MPTQNRRVATYLPKEIDDRLKVFIAERELKGDSQALIAILSEYFGVSQQVAQKVDYALFVTQEQFDELAVKVCEMATAIERSSSPSEATSDLPERIKQLEERIASLELAGKNARQTDKAGSVESFLPVPSQMSLLGVEQSDLPVSSKSELLKVEQSELESDSKSERPGQLELTQPEETEVFHPEHQEGSSDVELFSEPLKSNIQSNSEPLDDLNSELHNQENSSISNTANSKSLNELSNELLNTTQQEINTKLPLQPLSSAELAQRLSIHGKMPTNQWGKMKNPQKFAEWSRKLDPQGLAWTFIPSAKGKKKFFLRSGSETFNQVNPLPQSGRSEAERVDGQ